MPIIPNGLRPVKPAPISDEFPAPIPCSQMKKRDGDTAWIVHGLLAVGEITLLSALWKAGKTTLLTHVLKVLETGGEFCGAIARPARVLYVTEESEHHWAKRREALDLTDNASFIVRPFATKPTYDEWYRFIDYLAKLQDHSGYQLVVFDTISNLWPVKDENSATDVTASLMPLHSLTHKGGIAIAHHLSKGGGAQGTGSRGSGALPAFVDTILELRRYNPASLQDRRRLLTGFSRSDDTPVETVLELSPEGRYVASATGKQEATIQDVQEVLGLLIRQYPGSNADQLRLAWGRDGHGSAPARKTFLDALAVGCLSRSWVRSGSGAKGSPYTYSAE